jgi:hypothetical protein
MLFIIIVIILPILSSILVGVIVGDIQIQKTKCPPHVYSYVFTINGEYLQCVQCNFIPEHFL